MLVGISSSSGCTICFIPTPNGTSRADMPLLVFDTRAVTSPSTSTSTTTTTTTSTSFLDGSWTVRRFNQLRIPRLESHLSRVLVEHLQVPFLGVLDAFELMCSQRSTVVEFFACVQRGWGVQLARFTLDLRRDEECMTGQSHPYKKHSKHLGCEHVVVVVGWWMVGVQ